MKAKNKHKRPRAVDNHHFTGVRQGKPIRRKSSRKRRAAHVNKYAGRGNQ